MKAAEIRDKFLKYFSDKGHRIVESSSLVPQNDPTLLFTNAGMVQFKDVFLGQEKRDYKRATTSQKCVRAGGKHNDLENVGFTARHHTFFEMLGNFSFGDYFKKEAIAYAWEFVTQVLKIPKDRLYVTVFTDDDEAAELWEKQEKVPRERISRFGEKDNFWAMGDTGPCGPCTEIFIDRGQKFGCQKKGCAVGCDCDRFMEIWNLVFMQFNRDSSGKLHPLPKPSVDTGAGLERMASVMQNVETNYDTDIFLDIIQKTSALAGVKYQPGQSEAVSFRVIADHARATTFLINDGVLPSNEGRGYVLRRIMRRAIRHGRKLGFATPFVHKVCVFVIDQMKNAYPELVQQKDFIQKVALTEEEQFLRTLERGLSLLDEEVAKLGTKKELSGDVAFKLYDTYGFPLDLTRVITEEKGIGVDEAAFEVCMEKQKAESRKHWKGSGDDAVAAVFHQISEDFKKSGKSVEFTGYESLNENSACLALVLNGQRVNKVSASDIKNSEESQLQAVFAKTPFYGESGGQVGDQGLVEGSGFKADVVDVQKPLPHLIAAVLQIKEGSIEVGKNYLQKVKSNVRQLTACNHTATHLLHWALHEVLGNHVKQAGSLVNSELLRFDFTHFSPMTAEEISRVEDLINQKIQLSDPVLKEEMDKDAAIAKGAIAFFGEKYGNKVRVISVGKYSVELCGGTHVNRSSDIGLFKIVNEQGIASGVRRIVAYTSVEALKYLNTMASTVSLLRDRLKATSPDDLIQRIEKLQNTEKELRKTIEKLQSQSAGAEVDTLLSSAKQINGSLLIATECQFDPSGIKRLRDLSDKIRQKSPNAISVLGMADPANGKVFILAAVGPKAASTVKANELIQNLAPLIGGRGGGKPDMAQAGGTDPTGLGKALSQATDSVLQLLK